MRTPIFVYECNDLDVFESVNDAERKIEPIDVRNQEFVYYDADGQMLEAYVATDALGVERTAIREAPEKSFHPQLLRDILLQFLIASGEPKGDIEQLSLEDLVTISLKFVTR